MQNTTAHTVPDAVLFSHYSSHLPCIKCWSAVANHISFTKLVFGMDLFTTSLCRKPCCRDDMHRHTKLQNRQLYIALSEPLINGSGYYGSTIHPTAKVSEQVNRNSHIGTRFYNFQPITPTPSLQAPCLLHHRRWCSLMSKLKTYLTLLHVS